MCLAIPARIVSLLEDNQAIVEVSGVTKQISLALVKDIQVGDYIIMHVGFALNKLDQDDAEKTLQMFSDMLGASK